MVIGPGDLLRAGRVIHVQRLGPCAAAPHGEASVEHAWLAPPGGARHGGHAPRAERAEVAPGEAGEQRGWDRTGPHPLTPSPKGEGEQHYECECGTGEPA